MIETLGRQRSREMILAAIELSHHKAPIEVRERLTFDVNRLNQALVDLHGQTGQAAIIATCNRLSLYAYTPSLRPLQEFFEQHGISAEYLEVTAGAADTAAHLFRTASGLESQALGEHEILGQIKKAYALAHQLDTLGPELDELFRRAIYTGKKARKETAIGQYPVSLASVSFNLIKSRNRDLVQQGVLVLGTGEMAQLVLNVLHKAGIERIYVASKDLERAQAVSHVFNAIPCTQEQVQQLLPEIGIVYGCTYTEEPLIDAELLGQRENTLTLVDLGLPRNFCQQVREVEKVTLFDLDDIKEATEAGIEKRRQEIPKALAIVDAEVDEFVYWLNTREISPVITAYYEQLNRIQEEEYRWALPKLGDLDPAQEKVVLQLVSRVARRLSGKPIEQLKHMSQDPETRRQAVETFKALFDL